MISNKGTTGEQSMLFKPFIWRTSLNVHTYQWNKTITLLHYIHTYLSVIASNEQEATDNRPKSVRSVNITDMLKLSMGKNNITCNHRQIGVNILGLLNRF